MLNQKTKLISKVDTLKYILFKVTLMWNMSKWDMILSEFDIEYVDKKVIKGKVLYISWMKC